MTLLNLSFKIKLINIFGVICCDDMIILFIIRPFLYETFLAFRYIHPMEDKSKPLCNQSLNSGKTG